MLHTIDPTPANIGIAIPQLDQFGECDLVEGFSCELELHPVMTIDPSYPTDTVPPYMVGTVSLFNFLRSNNCLSFKDTHDIRILDFGRGKPFTSPQDGMKTDCVSCY